MLEPRHAQAIARAFSLGEDAVLTGPPARGEMGQIWRLTTSRGPFAVKQSFQRLDETDLQEEAEYEEVEYREAVSTAGVPAPQVIRTIGGVARPQRARGRTRQSDHPRNGVHRARIDANNDRIAS